MNKLFKTITGFEPYPFQLNAINNLLENKKQVITAPTGSGKTWMSLFPFIYAKENNLNFADRLFYVLPQRTLVTAIANTIKPNLKKRNLKVTIQMGGQNEDPYFEGDIIVTTIDQLLAAYLGLSYGTSRSASNIAPGALLGSYIILDEFHLLEMDKSLATFIDMINSLSPFVRTCMMTATATEELLKAISSKVNGNYQVVSGKEIVDLQKNLNAVRRRELVWNNEPINVDGILLAHKDRTLVVVNTVKKVQKLYKELKNYIAKANKDIEIICLHARFLKEDRNELEIEIKDALKQNSNKEVIVIANQVVEVGLDISASVLITELCPANALIQRIGRCERYGETIGTVIVHELEGKPLPYDTNIVNRTKTYIVKNSPLVMTAIEELQMVEKVHSNNEVDLLNQISFTAVRDKVVQTQKEGQRSNIKDLIRDIDNVQVIIHSRPWELDLNKKPEYFSIPYRTLQNELRSVEQIDKHAFIPEISDDNQKHYSIEVNWKPLNNLKHIHNYLFVVLSPKIATYSMETGFSLNQEGTFLSRETIDEIEKRKRFSYKKETYIEHALDVRRRIRCYDEIYSVFAGQIEKYLSKTIPINELTELVGALHDAGKLIDENVRVNQKWQQEIIGDITKEYLAHTDYDATNQYHVQMQKEYNRVPHAAEGAFSIFPIIATYIKKYQFDQAITTEIALAMYTAIKRHHGAYTQQMKKYCMVGDAPEIIQKSLTGFSINEVQLKMEVGPSKATQYSNFGVNSAIHKVGWLLYWYFSRRLRLADQLSQQEKI